MLLLLSLRSAAVLLYTAAASICFTAAIGLTAASLAAFISLNATAAAVIAAGALLGRRRRR
jgi:hypothetical protein